MPKSILLNKASAGAVDFASQEEGSYNITGVKVTRKYVEATDGMIAIRIPVSEFDSDDYPAIDGVPNTGPDSAVIPADTLRRVAKSIPKHGMPILQTVKVAQNGDSKITLTTTDLDAHSTVSVEPMAGNFPDLDKVLPERGKHAVKVRLNADLLVKICKFAKAHNKRKPHITMYFDDPTGDDKAIGSGIRFEVETEDYQKAEGVLMPVSF